MNLKKETNKKIKHVFINKNRQNKKDIFLKKPSFNKKIKHLLIYKNKKDKKGIFLKKPSFNKIHYPSNLNYKFINESLKKK